MKLYEMLLAIQEISPEACVQVCHPGRRKVHVEPTWGIFNGPKIACNGVRSTLPSAPTPDDAIINAWGAIVNSKCVEGASGTHFTWDAYTENWARLPG